MYCRNCGNQLDKDAIFCSKCGAKKDENDSYLYCEKCGTKILEDEAFCTGCGNPVSKEAVEEEKLDIRSLGIVLGIFCISTFLLWLIGLIII